MGGVGVGVGWGGVGWGVGDQGWGGVEPTYLYVVSWMCLYCPSDAKKRRNFVFTTC